MILSIGYVKLGRVFLDLPVKDTEAGYKFFNKEKILPVLEKTTNKHWFWDTEIVARSMISGLNVNYIPALFLKKTDKTSTVKLIPDTIHFLKSILQFRKTLASEKASPPGLIYKSTKLYEFVIQQLFGTDYKKRYKTILANIEPNSEILDVCCGDSKLFDFAKSKNVDYTGVDISLPFVKNVLRKGGKAIYADISSDPLPQADIVVLQGSLYQFGSPEKLVAKLYKSAKKKLIISESIHNLAQKSWLNYPLINLLSTKLVGTNHSNQKFRFKESDLKALLHKYNPSYIKVSGGRDLIAVINK